MGYNPYKIHQEKQFQDYNSGVRQKSKIRNSGFEIQN